MSDIKIVVMPHDGIINSELWLKCQKKIVRKNKKTRLEPSTTLQVGSSVKLPANNAA